MTSSIHSFKDLAATLNISVHDCEVEPTGHKCPTCGNEMRHVSNTNVYVCDHVDFVETELNGKPCQVFTPCKGVAYA